MQDESTAKFATKMTAPCSPCPSSTNSCISDSETSNDSGIDSLSGGGLPPEYMDLDEFLIMTGVKYDNKHSNRDFEITNKGLPIQGNQKTTGHQSIPTSQSGKENTNVKVEDSDTEIDKSKTIATQANRPKAQRRRNDKDVAEYAYKYNPLPVKRKAKCKFVSEHAKDDNYWKRRIRNNAAARRSRDMRCQREIEISAQWQDLENENARLKRELQKLKERASELERQLIEKEK